MHRKPWLFLLAALALTWHAAGTQAAAQATPAATGELQVDEAVMATGVSGLEPLGVASAFPADTPKLYCFTKISGGNSGDEVIHQWMKGDQVVASMTLKIKASPWRTYSMKTLPSDAVGKWSVKIMQGNKVLKVVPFEVK